MSIGTPGTSDSDSSTPEGRYWSTGGKYKNRGGAVVVVRRPICRPVGLPLFTVEGISRWYRYRQCWLIVGKTHFHYRNQI